MRYRFPARILQFLFHDQARLVEMVSALNLVAWAHVIHRAPELLDRTSYAMFQSLPPAAWVAIFGLAGAAQLWGMVARHRFAAEHRFLAMAQAAGCWTLIAVNFTLNTTASTAVASYALLALATALAGGFLGWKTSSPPS